MNLAEIEREIGLLENGPTSFANCEKLADLYIVRDRLTECMPELRPIMQEAPQERAASVSVAPIVEGGEFAEAWSNAPLSGLYEVMAEHMEAVQVLYPREFEAVLNKIKRVKEKSL